METGDGANSDDQPSSSVRGMTARMPDATWQQALPFGQPEPPGCRRTGRPAISWPALSTANRPEPGR